MNLRKQIFFWAAIASFTFSLTNASDLGIKDPETKELKTLKLTVELKTLKLTESATNSIVFAFPNILSCLTHKETLPLKEAHRNFNCLVESNQEYIALLTKGHVDEIMLILTSMV